jgi:type I restriction enzyme, S subunit
MKPMEGWRSKKLTELAEYINGYAFKPDDWKKDGLPIIRIEQLKNPIAPTDYYTGKLPTKQVIENGDLIFSWSASLFLRIWQHGRAALNQHLFKVVEKEDVDRIFLKLFIEFYLPELTKASHGSTMQHITRKELEKFAAPLPASKKEQTKIAEILSTVDRAIEQTEALIAKQQRIKTGLMQDLLSRGIDEHGDLRSEQIHQFKDSPLGRIPVEWEVELLDVLATRGSGHTPNKRRPEYWNGGIKWVSLSDSSKLDQGLIVETDKEISALGLKHSSAVMHSKGTVILSRDAGVGKSAILGENMAVSQHFIAWRCKPARLNNYYLYYWLQKDKPKFEGIASGSTIVTIGLQFFREYRIAAPRKISEQKQISEILDTADRSLKQAFGDLGKLRRLKIALMQDLLTGKKRVTPLLGV